MSSTNHVIIQTILAACNKSWCHVWEILFVVKGVAESKAASLMHNTR